MVYTIIMPYPPEIPETLLSCTGVLSYSKLLIILQTVIVKTQPLLNLTQLNSKQLYLSRVEVRHSSYKKSVFLLNN